MSNDILKILLTAEIKNTSLSGVQRQIDEIQKKAKPIKIDINVDNDKISKAAKNYEDWWTKAIRMREISEDRASVKLEQQEQKRIASLKEQIELFKRRQEIQAKNIETKYKDTYDSDALARFRTELQALDTTNPRVQSQMRSMAVDLREIGTEARNGQIGMQSLGQSVLSTVQRFAMFAGVNLSIYGMFSSIKKGVSIIKEMDDNLTQVSMVTGKTISQTRELAQGYASLGKELKTSVGDIISSSVSLFRQGLDDDTVSERLKIIAMTAKATAVDINQVTDFITAGVNASGMAAEEYSNTLIKASSMAGTSFEELGDGMSKVVSAAAVSGISVTKLTSYLSTLSETTRESSSSLGNSLKTIIARFNQINEETGEFNEDFNKVQTAIESVGIAFLGMDGQIRPVSDQLDDLSGIWDGLSKNTQQYLSTQIAGQRQISRFQALMENYGRSLEINNEIIDSSGTLTDQYTKYLNSAEASAQDAKVAFEQMWMNAINSDTIKTFYDMQASIIGAIDKVGLLNTAVFALSTVLLITSKSFQAFAGSMSMAKFTGFLNNLRQVPAAFTLARTEMGVFQSGLFALGVALDAAKIKAIAMQVALTLGLSVAITLAVSGLTKLATSVLNAKKEQEQLTETFLANASSARDSLKSLDDLVAKYESLAQQEKEGLDVKDQLLQVQRDLAKAFPETADAIDSEGNAITTNLELTKELTEEKRKLFEESIMLAKTEAESKIEGIQNEIDKLQQERDEIKNSIEKAKENPDSDYVMHNGKVTSLEKLNQLYRDNINLEIESINEKEKYNKAIADGVEIEKQQVANSYKAEIANAKNADQIQEITARAKEAGVSSEQLAGSLQKAGEDGAKALSKPIDKLKDYQAMLSEVSSGGLSEGSKSKILEQYPVLMKYMEHEVELKNKLIELIDEEDKENREKFEGLTKSFEDVTSKIQTYNVFLSELNSKEGLSSQAKQEIILKHQELLPYINDEMALRKHLMKVIQEEERVQKQAYVNMIMASEEYFNAKIRGTSFLYDQLGQFYTKDLENAKSLAEAKAMVENRLIDELTKAWGSYFNVQAAAFAGMQGAQDMALADMSQSDWNGMGKSQQDAFNKSYFKGMASQKAATAFSGIELSLGNMNFKDINMSNVKDPKKDKEKKDNRQFLESMDAEIRAIKAKNDNLQATEKSLQKQLELAKEMEGLDGLNEQYRITGELIKNNEEQLKSFKEEQDLIHARANKVRTDNSKYNTDSWFDGNGEQTTAYINQYNKASKKQQEEMSIVFGQVQALKKAWMESGGEIEGLTKSSHELGKSFGQLGLAKLVAEFELANQKFKEFDDTLADLAYDLKMLDPDDFGGKVENSMSVIDSLSGRVKQATIDLEALGENGFKEGSKEAKEFANQQAYLSGIVKEGTLSIVEQERALADLIKQQREKVRLEYIKKQNEALAEQRDRLSALESIQEAIVQIIRKRGEVEKKALDDAHKSEMDSLDKRHNDRKKKYQEETDLFKKMIQDKIDALDKQNEEEDYLEELQKERDKANELQKQIDVLSLDDSLTARNKVIELRKQLADQNEVIAKKQQKKERDLLKQSLQDQLKNREQEAKDKEDISDKIYDNEKKRLEEDYQISKEFLDKKYSDEKVYAEARESIMRGTVETSRGMFEDIYDAYQDFENKFGKGMGILGNIIKTDFLDQLDKAQQAIKDLEYNSRAKDDYSSDYDPGDRDLGWSDPRDDYRPSGGNSGSSRDPNYGVGSATGQAAKDNEAKLREDQRYRESEIRRAQEVIADRKKAGMSVKDQEAYLKRLMSGSYDNGGKITKTGFTLNQFHGTESSPEWIFNDSQLKNIIKDVTISAMKVTMPKLPNMGIGSGSAFQIDNLINIEGNVTKDTIPLIKQAGNDIAETLKNLNKGGIFRPVKR